MELIVGRILRPHGLRGEVIVEIRTDSPDERFVPGAALRTDPEAAGPLTIEQVRPHQGRLLVTFDGVYDRDVADNLRGVALWVDSSEVPDPTDPEEFLDHQLIGLRAETPDGEHLGDVVRIDHVPASDMLVLRLVDGRDGMVPFVRAIVPKVDVAGGRIVVTAPAGLFDL